MLTTPKQSRARDSDVESTISSSDGYYNIAFELDEEDATSNRSADGSRSQTPTTTNSQVTRPINILPSLPEEGTEDSDDDEQQESETQEKPKTIEVSTIVWVSCVASIIVIPLLMMLVAFLFFSCCPKMPSLPFLLFTTGAVMTVGNAFNIILAVLDSSRFKTSGNPSPKKALVASRGNTVINILTLILWLILMTWIHLHPRPAPSSSVSSTTTTSILLMNQETNASQVDSQASVVHADQLQEKVSQQECHQVLYLFSLYLVNFMLLLVTCIAVTRFLGYLGVFTFVCTAVGSKREDKP